MSKALGIALALNLAACAAAPEPQVIRYPNPSPTAPTSRSVEVPAGRNFVFISGQTPEPIAPAAPENSREYFGDTKAQVHTVMRKIEGQLKGVGLGLGDVVKMQVFLVGDPALGGRADFAGFAEAYGQYFGTAAQPHRPARTTMQIGGLQRQGMLAEIDVIAVRP